MNKNFSNYYLRFIFLIVREKILYFNLLPIVSLIPLNDDMTNQVLHHYIPYDTSLSVTSSLNGMKLIADNESKHKKFSSTYLIKK